MNFVVSQGSVTPLGALKFSSTNSKRMDGLTQHDSAANDRHYPILDALRFVLAFWVAVGHYEILPLFAGVDTSTSFGRFVTHAWQSVVFGTPAVIVFFVISGFCIHLPFRGDKKLAVGRYYLRRYTRILIPVAGALCVYRSMDRSSRFWASIPSSGNLRSGASPAKKSTMRRIRFCA